MCLSVNIIEIKARRAPTMGLLSRSVPLPSTALRYRNSQAARHIRDDKTLKTPASETIREARSIARNLIRNTDLDRTHYGPGRDSQRQLIPPLSFPPGRTPGRGRLPHAALRCSPAKSAGKHRAGLPQQEGVARRSTETPLCIPRTSEAVAGTRVPSIPSPVSPKKAQP
jgi:hypothetical protein